MVDLSISGGNLVLHVRGADKLWAFKSSLEIPLAHINEIRADPAIAHGWWHGIRMPGTSIPGVLTTGTFYQDGKRVFWDVHNPDRGSSFREIVRQQWNFSSPDATRETEDYAVDLSNVTLLDLTIEPDMENSKARASLLSLRLA